MKTIVLMLTLVASVALGADPPHVRAERLQWLRSGLPILERRSRQIAGTLSGGQQQLLAVALALARRPSVLVLDEAFIGLDTDHRDAVIQMIEQEASGGAAVLVAEPTGELATLICSRGYEMDRGHIEGGFDPRS